MALLLVTLTGCGERKSEVASAAPNERGATLLVTRDFGAETLVEARVAPGQSVLDALRLSAEVETTYGGRFVQAIDGLEGDAAAQRDWIFWVDGLKSDVGATDVQVRDGARIWWDRQRWTNSLPRVAVGAWPQPWPVVAGADADLRADDDLYRNAMEDPLGAGALAAIQDGAVVVSDGERVVPVAAARAIALGLAGDDGKPRLYLAGLDAAAATAARAALEERPDLLQGAFAAALDGAGNVVALGGRP